MMRFKKRRVKDNWIIQPQGPLDGVSSPILEAEVSNDSAGIRFLLLDLCSVHHVSSAGLEVLLRLGLGLARKRGRLVLVNVGPLLLELIQVSQVGSLLQIESDVTRGLERLSALPRG